MIKRIIKYIQYIIDFVKPSNKIFIAVDGVAPIAKINQQRKRRYKSVIDKEYQDNLNKKYKIHKNNVWSNIVITPGTKFMIKLDNALQNYCKSNTKIIYSSYNECGEGEHKIIRYIKNNNTSSKINNTIRHVIYGLDADLIFLAMSASCKENEIFLLRELQHLKNVKTEITDDVSEPLCYLSIENVINTYNDYILDKLEENEYIDDLDLTKKYDFSKDFIILCFLLGNDFIPNLPSINIRINGIEYLMEAYSKMFIYMKSYIYDVDKKEINWNNFKMIFNYLSDIEDDYFVEILPKHKYRTGMKKCNLSEQIDIEQWNHDNLKDIKTDDLIQLGSGNKNEYRFRYYEYTFNSAINQNKFIDKICKNYLEMIEWITKYYFDINMPSWQFCYYFSNSPFASDIDKFLDLNKINYNIEYKNPIDMKSQLLSVIPPHYSNLLVECNVDIKKFNTNKTKFMFPKHYELEYENKDQYWMCEAKLPMIDLELI